MKKVLVVVGPTAVGKTKISIELAKHYGLEIINADSVSIYKDLNIGSAKPTLKEMDGVKHYLIDIKEAGSQYSVKDFQDDARRIIDNDSNIKLICGGTGLYTQAVLFNYEFEAKERDFSLEEKYNSYNNMELYNLLLERDPNIDKEKIHPNNRKRVLRALEVLEETNNSIHSYNKKDEALYDYFICYLSMERDLLYERINKRVDEMINEGLIDEVKNLYDKNIYPHAIGYKEFIPYFKNEESLDLVIDNIKKNTRHLAKRQETWFRNQMKTHFYNVNINDINETIQSIIKDIDGWIK